MKISVFLVLVFALAACTNPKKSSIPQSKSIKTEAIPNKIMKTLDCSIRALEVVNDSTCWFAGSNNRVGFTEDFGQSWHTFKIEKDSLVLEFRSLAIRDGAVYVLSVGSPALLFKIDEKSLKYELVYEESGDKVFYDSMKFWDEKNGIAIGDPTHGCMSIIITKNGGATWSKIDCEKIPNAADGEAAFAASNTNLSLVDRKAIVVTGGRSSNVLIGEDFGTSWKKVNVPIIQGGQMTGVFTTDFADRNKGIIAGGNWEDMSNKTRAMAITEDGGLNWTLVEENPGFLSCVQFIPNKNELFGCSVKGVFRSQDGGESWKKVLDEGFYSLRFSENGQRVYFSGQNKLLSMSLNSLIDQ